MKLPQIKCKVVSTPLNFIHASYRVGRFVAMAFLNTERGNRQVLRIKYYLQGGDFIRNPQGLNLQISPLPVYLSHCNGTGDSIWITMAERHFSLFLIGRLITVETDI